MYVYMFVCLFKELILIIIVAIVAAIVTIVAIYSVAHKNSIARAVP